MGFFTTRERADLDKSTDEGEAKIRDFVRKDFAPRRRPPENERDFVPRRRPPENDLVAGNAGALLAQVTGATIKQIDGLIVELQAHRERLLGEGSRVQRAILEYAKMSQSTMQSTRIIAESLSYWNRIPDAPKIADVDGAFDAAVGRELRRDDLRRDDLGRSDLGRSDLGRSDLGRSDLGRSDLGRSDLDRTDLRRNDLGRNDLGRNAEIERELERSVAAALAQPIEEPANEPVEELAQELAEEATQQPAQASAQESAQESAEQSTEEPVVDVAAAESVATVLPDEASTQPSPEPIEIAEAPSVVADRPDAETVPHKT